MIIASNYNTHCDMEDPPEEEFNVNKEFLEGKTQLELEPYRNWKLSFAYGGRAFLPFPLEYGVTDNDLIKIEREGFPEFENIEDEFFDQPSGDIFFHEMFIHTDTQNSDVALGGGDVFLYAMSHSISPAVTLMRIFGQKKFTRYLDQLGISNSNYNVEFLHTTVVDCGEWGITEGPLVDFIYSTFDKPKYPLWSLQWGML